MKDVILDANFPRTADQRVYHLGIKAGEVANRIVTVGAPTRADRIASYLDASPKPFRLTTERGFTTITGRYKGVPISIISIGMGSSMVDFFIREVRECLSGDMFVVRLGSCGGLIDTAVGTVVVPRASIAVNRNYDFDFATGKSAEKPYRFSKPVYADTELRTAVATALHQHRPPTLQSGIITDAMNASTDSFYSSQGRQTSFPDHNEDIIPQLQAMHKDLASFEMETFHIFHLAASWPVTSHMSQTAAPPLSNVAVPPTISSDHEPSSQTDPPTQVNVLARDGQLLVPRPRIRAAAAQIIFAARTSRDFITPQDVVRIEEWCGKSVLEALIGTEIAPERLHTDEGSVWA
ncbi:purine and uridine phosphorylase [Cytidiella melzeri]|nr:purine and uridine phosphorylase [Cytidiella melzeri]